MRLFSLRWARRWRLWGNISSFPLFFVGLLVWQVFTYFGVILQYPNIRESHTNHKLPYCTIREPFNKENNIEKIHLWPCLLSSLARKQNLYSRFFTFKLVWDVLKCLSSSSLVFWRFPDRIHHQHRPPSVGKRELNLFHWQHLQCWPLHLPLYYSVNIHLPFKFIQTIFVFAMEIMNSTYVTKISTRGKSRINETLWIIH